jgi:hypothetical protein
LTVILSIPAVFIAAFQQSPLPLAPSAVHVVSLPHMMHRPPDILFHIFLAEMPQFPRIGHMRHISMSGAIVLHGSVWH